MRRKMRKVPTRFLPIPTSSYRFLQACKQIEPLPDPLGEPVLSQTPQTRWADQSSLQTEGHPCYLQNGWADQYPPTPVGRNSKKKIHLRYPLRRPQKRSKSLKKIVQKNVHSSQNKPKQSKTSKKPTSGRVQSGCN